MIEKIFHKLDYSKKATESFIIKEARSEIRPGSRILDIGAGEVKYKKYFSDCDFKTQDFKQYGKIDYVSDITEIPIPDQSFDIIISTEVLEHVLRPDLGIAEMSRILKPGGTLYITIPFRAGIHHLPHYHSGLSEFWHRYYLESYGFEKIEIKEKGGFFAFYGQEKLRSAIMVFKSPYFFLYPFALIGLVLVPLFYWLDKLNIDKYNRSYKSTMGYLIKARKK